MGINMLTFKDKMVVREHNPLGKDVELFCRHLYCDDKPNSTSKRAVGAELVDGLVIQEGDYKLMKTRFSAFFNTYLHSYHQGIDVTNLVIVALDYQRMTVIIDATATATLIYILGGSIKYHLRSKWLQIFSTEWDRRDLKVLKEFGTGGFVSFPICLATSLRDIKLVIQEQNSVPGIANQESSEIVIEAVCVYGRGKKTFLFKCYYREERWFLHPIDLAYAVADLIVSRAGVTICFKVLAVGKSCILISSHIVDG
ncbi:putative inactive nicotinamidase [Capsicum annuum]|nr:putative inactive nicotinamidase [Capsicum annuum]KAF3639400.1 putative inactive nicotinamidase [Capsicum annuum]